MSEKKPYDLFLFEGISYMVFNKDFTQVALSKKDNNIYIYSIEDIRNTDSWKLLYKLDIHILYISGLDWNPYTNKILSCSYDKTSFVWNFNDNKWIHSKVLSTSKLGYLCCKWNSRGDKFCEGTSDSNLLIGYYNTEAERWMTKNIEVHKSSVVCCEIDPTSLLVISVSTDFKVYISSCYLPKIDDIHLTEKTKYLVQKFGNILYEFPMNCWVNSVTWIPSGELGLVAGQDSTITVIDYKGKNNDIIKCSHSPVTFILANGEQSFYAVCYDRNILEYEKKNDKWEVKKTITVKYRLKSEMVSKEFNIKNEIYICRLGASPKCKIDPLPTKKNPYNHQSIISSIKIKDEILITTDVAGFIKYWEI